MMVKRAHFGVLGALFAILILSPASAQPSQMVEHLVVQAEDGRLNLLSANDRGQLSSLGSIEGFQLNLFGDSTHLVEWEITLPSQIVPSPDGRRVAFTAYSFARQETALFVFTPGQSDLIQVHLPGLASLSWLPDSAGILLYPPGIYTGRNNIEINDIYFYQMASGDFTVLTNTPRHREQSVTWLPEVQRVLHSGPDTACSPPCVSASDMYLTTLDGQSTALTDLGAQLPIDIPDNPYGFCRGRHPVWSDANFRVYYVANCHYPGGDLPYDLLYSADISGNNRLEANLPALFPDDEFIGIVGIHPTSDGQVYVVTASFNHYISGGFSDIWRVLLVTAPNQVKIVVDPRTAVPNPVVTALSPNETRLALSSQWDNGYLVVVKLGSGQYRQLPTTLSGNICDMKWLDAQRILGVEYGGGCDNAYRQPGDAYIFNVDTGLSDNITAGLDGIVWLLPTP